MIKALSIILTMAALTACGSDESSPTPEGAGGADAAIASDGTHLAADPDNVDAEAYYAALMDAGYESFAPAPGYETPLPSQGRHGSDVLVYINPVIEDALTQTGLVGWPDGSLLVKDGLYADGGIQMLSVMEKYGAEWYFTEYAADGTWLRGGLEYAECRACHADGNDAVIVVPLP